MSGLEVRIMLMPLMLAVWFSLHFEISLQVELIPYHMQNLLDLVRYIVVKTGKENWNMSAGCFERSSVLRRGGK